MIAHRCGRAYGPDSSRPALAAALTGGRLGGVETDVCITHDGALVCLHDTYLPLSSTVTGWAHERSAADVLAGQLLDGLGRASGQRPLLLDELLDLVPPTLTVQLDVKA
ncbi:MAG: glycerophosphodiester phosphodiesterase family protein, partial [Solirubrobacteraceae bacterium]